MKNDPSFRTFVKELKLSGIEPDLEMTPLHTRKRVRRPIVGYRVFIIRERIPASQRWENVSKAHWMNRSSVFGTTKSWPNGFNNSYPVEYDQPFIAMGVREGKYKVWGGNGIKIQDRHFREICDAISYAMEVIREEDWI